MKQRRERRHSLRWDTPNAVQSCGRHIILHSSCIARPRPKDVLSQDYHWEV